MLFKNVVLSALLATKALSSPYRITINIDDDQLEAAPVTVAEYPYESIIAGLQAQQSLVETLTDGVLTLSDSGSTGMTTTIANFRVYTRVVANQTKHLPKEPLGEGETDFVSKAFLNATDALVVLAESVYGYAATVKELDTDGKFYQRYQDARSVFGVYFSGLSKLLYKCDAEEKRDGCTGASPYNKEYDEVKKITLKALQSIRPIGLELNVQDDL